jgi:glutathione synthase/RimK-type ligase-like ATP-grasp enzyme
MPRAKKTTVVTDAPAPSKSTSKPAEPLRIGIIRGQENSFPEGLIANINKVAAEQKKNIVAEFVKLGGLKMAEPSPYTVILDRISHEIDFYRAYLKNAVLSGTYIVNNPFWWSADDKFFNYSLATKMGIPVPKTVILPSNEHPPNTTSESMRNLIYPLNWNECFEYVGFPLWIKPFDGGGWKHVYKIHSASEFFDKYNQTGTLCMVMQESIEFSEYYRCYCVGKTHVHIMPYEPRNPHHDRYKAGFSPSKDMEKRLKKYCIDLCEALGYDLNTLEFAVRDGVPYAIDYMNPAPDADYISVGHDNYTWILNTMTQFLMDKAEDVAENGSEQKFSARWDKLLNGK